MIAKRSMSGTKVSVPEVAPAFKHVNVKVFDVAANATVFCPKVIAD